MPSSHDRNLFPVAILAGGLATRLRPLTANMPKAMIPINGEPFIAHQLRLIQKRGIEHAVLCLGFKSEIVQEYVGNGSSFGLKVEYSLDGPILLGTGGALKRAIPKLGNRFFVIYGDSYLTCDYAAAQRQFLEAGKLALMTVFRNENSWDRSNVEFSDGQILAYSKAELTPRMGHIDYGLGMFDAAAFSEVREDTPYDLARLYRDLLARHELAGFETQDRFYEIGSFGGIHELSEYLASRK